MMIMEVRRSEVRGRIKHSLHLEDLCLGPLSLLPDTVLAKRGPLEEDFIPLYNLQHLFPLSFKSTLNKFTI